MTTPDREITDRLRDLHLEVHPDYEVLEKAAAELDHLKAELAARTDFMNREGYRRCDIAACNCNSWHGGHAANRLREAHEAVSEAGGSTNGVILTDAILALGTSLALANTRLAACEMALMYARVHVAKYAHTQGDNAEFHAELLAPIDAALPPPPTGGEA